MIESEFDKKCIAGILNDALVQIGVIGLENKDVMNDVKKCVNILAPLIADIDPEEYGHYLGEDDLKELEPINKSEIKLAILSALTAFSNFSQSSGLSKLNKRFAFIKLLFHNIEVR